MYCTRANYPYIYILRTYHMSIKQYELLLFVVAAVNVVRTSIRSTEQNKKMDVICTNNDTCMLLTKFKVVIGFYCSLINIWQYALEASLNI